MPDVVYINGSPVSGLKFPSVDTYNAYLEPQDKDAFDAVVKALLPESTIALLDDSGAVFVINGSNIRVFFKAQQIPPQNAKESKKSSFVTA